MALALRGIDGALEIGFALCMSDQETACVRHSRSVMSAMQTVSERLCIMHRLAARVLILQGRTAICTGSRLLIFSINLIYMIYLFYHVAISMTSHLTKRGWHGAREAN